MIRRLILIGLMAAAPCVLSGCVVDDAVSAINPFDDDVDYVVRQKKDDGSKRTIVRMKDGRTYVIKQRSHQRD